MTIYLAIDDVAKESYVDKERLGVGQVTVVIQPLFSRNT
jgi:hypothetical protein